MDYFAEVHGIYSALALQENIPVDFVDEDGMQDTVKLAEFTTLFLTQPNVPAASVPVLVAWVKAGGTLVTTSNAAHWDEYDEPLAALQALGIHEVPRNRTLLGPFHHHHPPFPDGGGAAWQKNGSAVDGAGYFAAWGATSSARSTGPSTGRVHVLATFDDGTPATVENTVGSGRAVHFFWLPGVSHSYGGGGANCSGPCPWPGGAETGAAWSETRQTIGEMLAAATRREGDATLLEHEPKQARVVTSEKWVETPLLADNSTGAVVTLLNWRGKPIPQLQLNVSLGFSPSKVVSVVHGPVVAAVGGDGMMSLSLSLEAADFILFHK